MKNKIPKAVKEAAKKELLARAKVRITPELLAGDHKKQLEVYKSTAAAIILLCSRRAGKSDVCMGLLLLTALATPNVSCLYLALVSRQAQTVFIKKWKPLLRRLGVVATHTADLSTTFENGSTVVFGGIDDARHVATLLGDSMAGGMAVCDELQSAPSVVQALVEEILSPMLAEVNAEKPFPGRLVLAGTIPRPRVGYLWSTFERGLINSEIDNEKSDDGWDRFNWNRFDNPYLLDNDAQLQSILKRYNWTVDHPTVQNDYFGNYHAESDVHAINYNSTRAGYIPTIAAWSKTYSLPPGKLLVAEPPPGIDRFGLGMDAAGKADRYSIVMVGWSSIQNLGCWEIAEWTTPKASNVQESQYVEVLKVLKEKYPKIGRIIRDQGSVSIENDLFYRSHGIWIEAALKGPNSRKIRVDRLGDLIESGEFHVIEGGELENDLRRAQWSIKKRSQGLWDWDPIHHPDVLDACSYIIPAYISRKEKTTIGMQLPQVEQERLLVQQFIKKNYKEFVPKKPAYNQQILDLWKSKG
jgi:hypothetical protein